jgi:hypothetical protein
MDWKTTTDGDLVIEKGDIALVDENEAAKQEVLFRLQTGLFDYDPAPEFGAGLDQFIGQPNRADTGGRIRRAVIRALTHDAKFPTNTVQVEVVPLDIHTIGIYVFVVPRFTGTFTPVTVAVSLDLTVGTISLITG